MRQTRILTFFPLDLQVSPWLSISTQEASVETLRLLEGPFSTQIDERDLNRATQLGIGELKSMELQTSEIVSKEAKGKEETPYQSHR